MTDQEIKEACKFVHGNREFIEKELIKSAVDKTFKCPKSSSNQAKYLRIEKSL